MTTEGEPIEQLSRALDQTGAIIAAVRPDEAGLPTPCPAWDVAALINHVVEDVQHFTASASGERWERGQARDLIGDDWLGAYRRSADELLAAWRRPSAVDRKVQLPFGEYPATWIVYQHIADIVVHGWDLATATGRSADLDPELSDVSLAWARDALRPEFRGDEASGRSFGPEVAVPDDAPAIDRLVGFFGRDPSAPLTR